jgi:molecular chaperone DnaK (HSP70)
MEDLWSPEEQPYRFVVGIDLGTTNSAVAYADRTHTGTPRQRIRIFDIPQLVASGEVGHRPVLPSFLYLPGPFELPAGSTALPWDPERAYAVGEFAREQGALVPGHLLSSAKSWLCHAGVDRTAPILPWGAASDVAKLSPVESSGRYLQHIREAWNQVIARGRDGDLLEQQLIVLTVPASFDEVARELTVQAAQQAGLMRVILLEEPLAAFYAWLNEHARSGDNPAAGSGKDSSQVLERQEGSSRDPATAAAAGSPSEFAEVTDSIQGSSWSGDWQAAMQPGQIILVCDVGGGTTDFTMVSVQAGKKGLRFDRLAVGEHLMLGGDNMDLAIARHIEMQLLGQPGKLESRRWHQLCHQCRKAKETLLSDSRQEQMDIIVVGTGGKLIADTLRATLTRSQVEELILDGFFPLTDIEDAPQQGRRSGLSELGLPYVADPAITRHLAAFWRRHLEMLREETGRTALYPDYLLFNGGALTPEAVRRRIAAAVRHWFKADAGPEWVPQELPNSQPELAVAVGAAYYGLVRLGEGIRVGAGSPRAYFVEVAAAAEDLGAGEETAVQAVCLVPRGAEEGFTGELPQPAFEVLANQPVAFQLFSSSTRLGDHPGDIVRLSKDEISTLPPIRTVLRYGKRDLARGIPVRLAVRLTEIGILELWCRSQQTDHRWQLQFDVRTRQEGELADGAVLPGGETIDAAAAEAAQELIRSVYAGIGQTAAVPPERLIKELVALVELPKERWSAPLIRKLADTLLECEAGRGASPQHEARWLNLLGYCLRPGYGDPLDAWRMKQVWKLFPQELRFPRQVQGRSEWWVFWRRVAGGLNAGQQNFVYQQLAPYFIGADAKKKAAKRPVKRANLQEMLEIWMALANFERLPTGTKSELGRLLLQNLAKGGYKPQELWALSRLGARVPFYGPVDRVVSSKDAASWVKTLMSAVPQPTVEMAQALVQLARPSGDRARDLSREDLEHILRWLQPLPQADRWVELLTHADAALEQQEQDWVFGESLPVGLRVVSEENL